jgi:hypothetical protein
MTKRGLPIPGFPCAADVPVCPILRPSRSTSAKRTGPEVRLVALSAVEMRWHVRCHYIIMAPISSASALPIIVHAKRTGPDICLVIASVASTEAIPPLFSWPWWPTACCGFPSYTLRSRAFGPDSSLRSRGTSGRIERSRNAVAGARSDAKGAGPIIATTKQVIHRMVAGADLYSKLFEDCTR